MIALDGEQLAAPAARTAPCTATTSATERSTRARARCPAVQSLASRLIKLARPPPLLPSCSEPKAGQLPATLLGSALSANNKSQVLAVFAPTAKTVGVRRRQTGTASLILRPRRKVRTQTHFVVSPVGLHNKDSCQFSWLLLSFRCVCVCVCVTVEES